MCLSVCFSSSFALWFFLNVIPSRVGALFVDGWVIS
jgi:hypothetical protein